FVEIDSLPEIARHIVANRYVAQYIGLGLPVHQTSIKRKSLRKIIASRPMLAQNGVRLAYQSEQIGFLSVIAQSAKPSEPLRIFINSRPLRLCSAFQPKPFSFEKQFIRFKRLSILRRRLLHLFNRHTVSPGQDIFIAFGSADPQPIISGSIGQEEKILIPLRPAS